MNEMNPVRVVRPRVRIARTHARTHAMDGWMDAYAFHRTSSYHQQYRRVGVSRLRVDNQSVGWMHQSSRLSSPVFRSDESFIIDECVMRA